MNMERWDDGAQHVAELALREALSFGHNYIGAHHIALALTRFAEEPAGDVIRAAFRHVGKKPVELRSAIALAYSRKCPTCGHVREVET